MPARIGVMDIGLKSAGDDAWDAFGMGTILSKLKLSGTQESFKEVFNSSTTVSAREWASFHTQCGDATSTSGRISELTLHKFGVETVVAGQRLYTQSQPALCNVRSSILMQTYY